MKRILVTGSTGTIGSEVVAQLAGSEVQVRALTRNSQKAVMPAGVEVAQGDLTDPASLDRCLAHVDAVFLVWTAPLSAAAEAIARIAQHAKHLVLLSAPHQTPHPFFQQPNPMAAMQRELERLIVASGLTWTFVRPTMFAANALHWWAPQIRHGDVVRWPYGDAPTSPIHERDVAAVAVRALLDSAHEGRDYVITGPESLTQREQVLAIGEVLGRPLRFDELTPDEAREQLGFPPAAADMLFNAWSAALGQPAYLTSSVEEITGNPARAFREWVRDHAAAFTANP